MATAMVYQQRSNSTMFKALYESYLSPIYWLLRMFGKDTKDKYRDDIPEDLFRLCLKPKAGVEAKKIQKTIRHIYGKIAGVDDGSINDAVSDYFQLAKKLTDAKLNNESWDFIDDLQEELDEYVVDTFTLEVSEDQRKNILDYLKNNMFMIVANDEYKEMHNKFEWEKSIRKYERFRAETLQNMADEAKVKSEEPMSSNAILDVYVEED